MRCCSVQQAPPAVRVAAHGCQHVPSAAPLLLIVAPAPRSPAPACNRQAHYHLREHVQARCSAHQHLSPAQAATLSCRHVPSVVQLPPILSLAPHTTAPAQKAGSYRRLSSALHQSLQDCFLATSPFCLDSPPEQSSPKDGPEVFAGLNLLCLSLHLPAPMCQMHSRTVEADHHQLWYDSMPPEKGPPHLPLGNHPAQHPASMQR